MREIKCPNCGEVFAVDESGYAQILQQVRDKEFDQELKRREKDLEQVKEKNLEIVSMKQKQEFDQNLALKEQELSEKEKEIEQLKAKISESENLKNLAISETINKKEKEREDAIAQKNSELADKDRLIEQLKSQIVENENMKKLAVSEVINEKEKEQAHALKEKDSELLEKDKEIRKKEEEIAKLREEFLSKKSKAMEEIAQLREQISGKETEKKLAVSEAVKRKEAEVSKKITEIESLKGQLTNKETENELKEQALRKEYEEKLKLKDEQIEYYKDFKARQSTKMVGESLEQHCLNQFNTLRMTAFPEAYFEKDNDAKSGSKGDFIFRESRDGTEFISIMFEMKNEMDETATKHKNEDFFKELDKDRREKKCEYAVLVSLLEIDNDLYNNGIVDVSYKYEKMYVIRPQFFIPMITLLRNAALNSVKYRQELEIAKNQQIDILHFEENMNTFKEGFARNYRIASERFNTAIEEIDKTIQHLQKTKQALLSSENNLRLANKKAEDLSIKKLTKGAPAVKKMFDEIRHEN